MYVSLRKDAGGFFAYLEILFCSFCKALGICNFRHSNGVYRRHHESLLFRYLIDTNGVNLHKLLGRPTSLSS